MTPDTKRCPVCGRDNRCGAEAGRSTCWCDGVRVDPAVLAALPEELQGKACLCPDCARGEIPSPCTGLCELDPATNGCRSCGRSAAEIEAWWDGSAADKVAILRQLAARRRG